VKAEKYSDDRPGFILGVPGRRDNIPLTNSLCTGYTTGWLLARLFFPTLGSGDDRPTRADDGSSGGGTVKNARI
jgi:hypothetical protein